MTKIKLKKTATSLAIYGGLIMLGAVSGQQLGQLVTGHSLFAHASGQVNTEAVADNTDAPREQQPKDIGPCNCPLCCRI